MRKLHLDNPYTAAELALENKWLEFFITLAWISFGTLVLTVPAAATLALYFPYAGNWVLLVPAPSLGLFLLSIFYGGRRDSGTAEMVDADFLTRFPPYCKQLSEILEIPDLAGYVCAVREQERELTSFELDQLWRIAIDREWQSERQKDEQFQRNQALEVLRRVGVDCQ